MLSSDLLLWFSGHRRSLPWREGRTPYSTWISEAMLQQTRVATVLDYYPRFLEAFPDPRSLAEAKEERVLKLWEGLGYYSRARNLQKGAIYLCEKCNGTLPSSRDELLQVPGIGPYMAGAISSLAFQKKEPAVDGNAIRIYTRLHALPLPATDKATYNEVFSRIEKDMPEDAPGDFNEALMDLGSLICTPRSPKCSVCPFSSYCSACLLGKAEDFPVKKPKKAVPVEEHTILKIYVGKKLLVRKRPDQGLLAGLYEYISLPGIKTNHEIRTWLSENFGTAIKPPTNSGTISASESKSDTVEPDIRPLGNAHHIFSHLRWEMLGYEIHLSSCDPAEKRKLTSRAKKLGTLVSEKEYETLAFPSALKAYSGFNAQLPACRRPHS